VMRIVMMIFILSINRNASCHGQRAQKK
jgi:hypothetical protein